MYSTQGNIKNFDKLCLLISVLKAAGVSAETRERGRELFQIATMRFEKTFLWVFNLVRGITRRRW